eukprot:UN25965
MPFPKENFDVNRCKKLQKRLLVRYKKLTDNPVHNSIVKMTKKNMREWYIVFDGPKDTPYEGGRFMLKVVFPLDYPFNPPKVTFVTPIFHCNIAKGNICVDILKDRWSPVQSMSSLLNSLSLLLTTPNPDDPLNGTAAKLYKTDIAQHDIQAREMTKLYAVLKPAIKDATKIKSRCFGTSYR